MKILIVSHDAGGAEIVSSWVRKNSGNDYTYVLDGPAAEIFRRKIIGLKNNSLSKIASLVQGSDLVMTGTSWASDIEKQTILIAKGKGVKTVSFIDHWANYPQRLTYKGKMILPDQIWVGDEDGHKEARKHFPENIIRLVPNPYYEDIKEDLAQINKDQQPMDKIKILYICEPIVEHVEREYGDPNYLGYNEYSALNNFLCYLSTRIKIENIYEVRIRQHPAEVINKYREITGRYPNLPLKMSKQTTLVEDCTWADQIYGCESMGMVIGLIARKKVFSVIPPGGKACSLPHKGIIRLFENEGGNNMAENELLKDAFLVGNKVYLRALNEQDAEGNWYKWFNDQEVTKYVEKGIFPNTKEKQKAHLINMQNSSSDLLLAIIDKKTHAHVGVIGLHNINWIYRKAEISIILGEKGAWGADSGLEAMALMIGHGFEKLNLNKIYAGQHEGLGKWRKTLELIGFKTEGVLKDELFTQGRYWDAVRIAVFACDYFKLLEERGGKILGDSVRELIRERRNRERS